MVEQVGSILGMFLKVMNKSNEFSNIERLKEITSKVSAIGPEETAKKILHMENHICYLEERIRELKITTTDEEADDGQGTD